MNLPNLSEFNRIDTESSIILKNSYGGNKYETREQFQERFWRCIIRKPYTEGLHWYWKGSKDPQGRPIFAYNGIKMLVRDLIYAWKDSQPNANHDDINVYYDGICTCLECLNPVHEYDDTEYEPIINAELSPYAKMKLKDLYGTKQYTTVDLAELLQIKRRTVSNFITANVFKPAAPYRKLKLKPKRS